MDFLLNEETHDVVFTNGEIPVTGDSKQHVSQRLKIKLLTYLGEWFLNSSVGVPYQQQIFGKVKSKAAIDAIFIEQITSEPDVVDLVEFYSTISPDRRYSVRFRVRTNTGQITDPIEI